MELAIRFVYMVVATALGWYFGGWAVGLAVLIGLNVAALLIR